MQHKIHNVFPTLVMEFNLNADVDTKLLQGVLLQETVKPHPLLVNAKSSYFAGNHNVLDIDHPLVKKLKECFEHCVNLYVETAGLTQCEISNSWMSIMDKDSTLVPHRHENSVISGAYYPKVPDSSVGLKFFNPTKIYKMCETHQETSMYNADNGEFPAKEGILYLFPSWLEHGSETNQTENRIVISFNTLNIRGMKQ